MVPYLAAWAEEGASLAGRLREMLPGAISVQHIGSTSVPGLAAKDVIALEKRKITGGTQSVEFVVDRKPAFVGIDPYTKLISRNTSSNVIAVP